jgi:hypothetical protein
VTLAALYKLEKQEHRENVKRCRITKRSEMNRFPTYQQWLQEKANSIWGALEEKQRLLLFTGYRIEPPVSMYLFPASTL